MKTTTLRKLLILWMAFITCWNPSLVGAKEKPVLNRYLSEIQIEPTKKYDLRLKDGQIFKRVLGKSIAVSEGEWAIHQKNKKARISTDQLESIRAQTGTHIWKGTGIGALSGFAVGAAAGIPAIAGAGCDDSGDPGDCKALGFVAGWAMWGSATVVGSLIGLGIGAATPKMETIRVVPVIAHDEKQTVGGAAVSFAF